MALLTKPPLFRRGPATIPLLLLTLLGFAMAGAPRISAQPSESELKAAFLYNFCQFTDFPTNAFPATNSPFVILILGDNPFGNTLTELTRGEHIRGHPIEVRVTRSLDPAAEVHLLYIAPPTTGRWQQVVQTVSNRAVLTVSELENFARSGGMIRLYSEAGRVRFNINPAAARMVGISFNSKLLRLARIVGPEGVN